MLLNIKSITKIHKKRKILNDVSLTINQGKIVGIIGPNGSGKTTLFNIISGVIGASKGNIILDNTDITNLPIYDKGQLGIYYLPQESTIFDKLSVVKNLKIALEAKYSNHNIIKNKIETILNNFNLQALKHNKCENLSCGEQHKIEIARIVAMEPKFLLLDEPFSWIDLKTLNDIQDILTTLKHNNVGIMLTDHNIHRIANIADIIYVIVNGEIICSGTPNEILNNSDAKEQYLGNNIYF